MNFAGDGDVPTCAFELGFPDRELASVVGAVVMWKIHSSPWSITFPKLCVSPGETGPSLSHPSRALPVTSTSRRYGVSLTTRTRSTNSGPRSAAWIPTKSATAIAPARMPLYTRPASITKGINRKHADNARTTPCDTSVTTPRSRAARRSRMDTWICSVHSQEKVTLEARHRPMASRTRVEERVPSVATHASETRGGCAARLEEPARRRRAERDGAAKRLKRLMRPMMLGASSCPEGSGCDGGQTKGG